MTTFLWVLLISLLWCIVGAGVWAAIDTPNEAFYRWYKDCPFPGIGHTLVLAAWPVGLYFWFKARRSE